ncbi:MAG: Gfo/Idh/MocA family oxidoreductase [Xanthobacteraceae bacterium]|nr:Gfo/Idh/MocA family oxidoreductase [Xanthobacteraceae bacterium]
MTLRLGLVGHGRWGRNIERTLLAFPDVSVAIVDKGSRPAAGLDGVLIATPSASHADAALPYIELGVPTFIEKPLATSVSDAERIRDAARRSGAVVFVGHVFLHHPGFLAALELQPSLGPVRYILSEGMNQSPRSDSSVLWDWLPHSLSMACTLAARDPDSVAAWSLSGVSIPQAAVAKFQYGEVPLVSTTSWLSPIPRMRMTITCEQGTLVFDSKAPRQLTAYGGRGEVSYPAYSEELPLTREMTHFLAAVKSGNADLSQIETGLAIVRAIAAAHESIARGGNLVKL